MTTYLLQISQLIAKLRSLSKNQLWKMRIFLFMWAGYILYYFSRKSFTIATPALMVDLDLDKAQVGMIASALTFCYGFSKFTSGVLADKMSPRVLMALGLILTGSVNILFGFSSSLYALVIWWGVNGWFQGLGALPCSKLLVQWYPQKERGRWWSSWNTSHNVGAISIAVLVGYLVTHGSWRVALWVPGAICIIGGLIVLKGLRDSPESVGLPSLDNEKSSSSSQKQQAPSLREIIFEHLLKNKVLFLLAAIYFLVYAVRIGICDWTIIYLTEVKEYGLSEAIQLFILFEIGGFIGNLVAGWSSDTLFDGKRGPVNVLFMAGAALSVFCIWMAPEESHSTFVTACGIFFSGFFIFGPQMLVGVQAAEAVDKKVAASGNGFVCLFGYLGASSAGYPLGRICEDYGWSGFFFAVLFCAVAAFALLLPLWSQQAYAKRFQNKSIHKQQVA